MVHATESEDHCSDTDSVGYVKRHVAVNIISNSSKNSLHSSTEGVNDRLMSPPPRTFLHFRLLYAISLYLET